MNFGSIHIFVIFSFVCVIMSKKYIGSVTMRKQIVQMLGNTEKSYYRWKEEGRPIIAFLERYFTKEDLEEFLKTGMMSKLENTEDNQMSYMLLEYVRYNLKGKLSNAFETISSWSDKYIHKKNFIETLQSISSDPKFEIEKHKSKDFLIKAIEEYKIQGFSKVKKEQIINIFKNNFSNLECYTLIKYADEFLEDK